LSQDEKDALYPESIALENPAWVPKMESTVNQAHRAANLEEAWNDPDFFNPTWRPLFIPPKLEHSPDPVNDEGNDKTQVSQHCNVTHGERQALCAQQNQRFQDMCVNRPSAPLHEDEGVMTPKLPTEQVVDGNRKFLTSMILLYIYISTSVLIVVSYIEPQRASKRYVLIGHLLHYTKMVSWLLDYLQNIWRMIIVSF
jgi:hypothetical protein